MSERRRALGLVGGVLACYAVLGAIAWVVNGWIPQWETFLGDRKPGSAVMAMLGALALVGPVAWVYMRTKPKANYDASLVQTVIVLPVVISGVVLIVRDSVALAFSLAGIVAAVRFRNTLRDTKDAVYVFLAIAVGLSTGVQSFAVGLAVSVIFSLVILFLWRFDIGHVPDSGGERVQGRLMIETELAAAAEPTVAGILKRHARRWKLVQTESGGLTFAVQLRRRGDPDALVAALREESALRATRVRFEPSAS